ncbi:hypothetical protein ACFVT5_00340 [Streptomyces sp. NPDC058001]|uniref:hypothetical protein n=1 Tax=Streptomyces sp. NPDC058001 TaxID=3346300 RepID=UPI0036E6A9F2
MYTIEMAYARMRELQELADRSRAHQPTTTRRAGTGRKRRRSAGGAGGSVA